MGDSVSKEEEEKKVETLEKIKEAYDRQDIMTEIVFQITNNTGLTAVVEATELKAGGPKDGEEIPDKFEENTSFSLVQIEAKKGIEGKMILQFDGIKGGEKTLFTLR